MTSTINGPQGTFAAKTTVSLSLLEKGLERLDKNIDVLSPGFSIKPEVCLTIQVENVHAVSHFKHPTCTLKESLKRATKWSAYYFTQAREYSYYPVPQTKVPLRDIPKLKRLPVLVTVMSKRDMDSMRQWASEHSKAVRQLSVPQNNTKHAAGTLPLSMYRKELPIGDQVTEESSSADDSCRSTILMPATMKTMPPTKKRQSRLCLQIFYQGQCTRVQDDPSRCRIARIHHTEVWKAISLFHYSLKTRANWKYQSKGQCTDYILLAFAEIVFFKGILGERRKRDSG